jgi:hypothetical protein
MTPTRDPEPAADNAGSIDLSSALLGGAFADGEDDVDSADDAAGDLEAVDAWFEALVDAALAQGQTRAAAAVGELLSNRSVEAATLPDAAATLLERTGIAKVRRGRVRPLPEFREAVAGWQSVLRGDSAGGGSDAWGAESLDDFSAGLLAALSGDASERDGFKRMLRQRGVAAFGMLESEAA